MRSPLQVIRGRQDRFRREWMLGQLHPEGFRASSIVETMEAMFVPYQCEGHRRRYSCEACGPRRKAMRMKTPSLPSLAKSNFDQPGAMRVSAPMPAAIDVPPPEACPLACRRRSVLRQAHDAQQTRRARQALDRAAHFEQQVAKRDVVRSPPRTTVGAWNKGPP